ncbi:MAG: metallophosphoesterase [Planctomycetes bacterium]|nr:metallophosphoesterase [Planctomycetota bacterium]MBI3834791.1 metallophosphoesterase [Planctomycetota bacterium]
MLPAISHECAQEIQTRLGQGIPPLAKRRVGQYQARMLVGVISDTHDRLPKIDAAMALFVERRVESMIHAGDFVAPFAVKRLLPAVRDPGSPNSVSAPNVPLYATYGNNDGERAGIKSLLPQVVDGPLHIELGGRRILVHHFVNWCEPADINRAEIIITGHSHEVVNRIERGKLFLNPGECCGWVTGRSTVAILDTDGPSAEVFEI